MPRAGRICHEPGCPNDQPCPIHRKQPWQGSTRAKRLPPNWSRIRATILLRDPTCTIQSHCQGSPSTEVDHINRGDDHSFSNLRGTCAPCHAAKSGAEGQAARG